MSLYRQRGMTTGWVIAIVAAVLAIIWGITAMIGAWHSFVADIDKQGYDRGYSVAAKERSERDQKAIAAAIGERNAVQLKLDDALAVNTKLQTAADENYRKGQRDAKAQYDRDMSDVRSGKLVLRDPKKGGASSLCNVSGSPANKDSPAASGPGVAGAGDNRLSEESAGFLLWLGAEANRLRDKVNTLITTVKGDRKQINGAWDEQGHPALQLAATLTGGALP